MIKLIPGAVKMIYMEHASNADMWMVTASPQNGVVTRIDLQSGKRFPENQWQITSSDSSGIAYVYANHNNIYWGLRSGLVGKSVLPRPGAVRSLESPRVYPSNHESEITFLTTALAVADILLTKQIDDATTPSCSMSTTESSATSSTSASRRRKSSPPRNEVGNLMPREHPSKDRRKSFSNVAQKKVIDMLLCSASSNGQIRICREADGQVCWTLKKSTVTSRQ